MTIYIDELFFNNLFITYFVLIAVKKILNKTCSCWRLFFSSIISTILSIILILYDENNNIVLKISVLLITAYIAFIPKNLKTLIPEMITILIVTLILGGICSSTINKATELLLLLVISLIGIKEYNEYYKKKKWRTRNTYTLKINIANREIELKAFLDTGNMLQEMFSSESVIIIYEEAIEGKVPRNIIDALRDGNFEGIDFNVLKNIRPITYSVINEREKNMYGLKIKNIEIYVENRKIVRNAVITIANHKFNGADALIGINLLEGGYESGYFDNAKAENKNAKETLTSTSSHSIIILTFVRFRSNSMNKLPQISDAEFEVMDIIWKYAPISTNEITDRLAKTKNWSPKTIYTMLSRLEKKGVIVHEKESRVFVYTPCVKKDDYLAAESRTLADRFFDGAMKQMVVSFLDQKDLTPEDLDELQSILDKKRRQ